MRRFRSVSITIAAVIVIAGGIFAYLSWNSSDDMEEAGVTIPTGAAFTEILDSLDAAGLIESRTAFRVLALATGNDDRIMPGTYKFRKGISQAELLGALVDGHSNVRVRLTFPEGSTIRQMASIAAKSVGADSVEFVRLANDREFLKSIGLNAETAEGYLMPDTYFVYWGERPGEIIRRMARIFLEFYNDTLKLKAEKQGLTPYQAVVLASLVEGEARVDKERPIIAGLYLNRLRKEVKLDADPTIQYILPDAPRRLYYKDLKIDSPYNTYLYKGLPPTPINNPGRASIKAALNPASHDYLFMVAKADGSGEHNFSKTGQEHERAVRQYRRRVNG